MPFIHQIIIMGGATRVDDIINDFVCETVEFYIQTTNIANGDECASNIITVSYNPPDANNFIPYNQIDIKITNLWINDLVDIAALQKINIDILKARQ